MAWGKEMTKQNVDLPILIVGGGIGGAATALALSRKGKRVQVLEQSPTLREIGAGIQMPPNAFKAFAALGVLTEMQAVAAYPEELIFGDMITGDLVYRAPIDEAFVERFGFPYALLHRGDILENLVRACRASNLITLTSGEKIISFQDTDEKVVVVSASGSTYEGQAVVFCDGLWSLGRSTIVGDGLPRTDGYILCRGVVPVANIPQELYSQSVTMWGGPGLDFFHYPLRRDEVFNIGASFYDPNVKVGPNYPAISRDTLFEKFKDASPHIRALLEHIDTSKSWVLHDRFPIEKWSKGRTTLLGDAAHPTSIYTSQGACMALEDAVILAEIVSNADSIEGAFETYQNVRYLRTARIQFISREFGKLYHARGVQKELRNQLLSSAKPTALADTLSWLWTDPLAV